jgi:hypothetical protein
MLADAGLVSFAEPCVAVGLYKLSPVDPKLETIWFQALDPANEKLVFQNFAFSNANLVPLHGGVPRGERRVRGVLTGEGEHGGGGRGRGGACTS